MLKKNIPVALKKCPAYAWDEVRRAVGDCLEAASLNLPARAKILVKPNLLTRKKLACTHPFVTAAVCAWLLDQGHKPVVSDSPAFGTAKKIATFLGLDSLLKKMDVAIVEMANPRPLPVKLPNESHALIPVGSPALDSDVIFSLPKLKAHGQMRVTLAVKNCFGCVPGAKKAILHTLKGSTHEEFASWLAALYLALPPVVALCDGIVSMTGTGPTKGEPCHLGLIAACSSPLLLDLEILKILNVPAQETPLSRILLKMRTHFSHCAVEYPLDKPEEFDGSGFRTPQILKAASFSPAFLFKSMIRRWWAASGLSKQIHETGNGKNAKNGG